MIPFFWREVAVIGRSPAFAISLGLHSGALAAFVLLWGGGMPVLPGTTVSEQLLLVQGAVLTALLPWTAARCGATERGDIVVMLAAATATPPSRVLLGQCLGRFIALVAVVVTALPIVIVAQQMSAAPLPRIGLDLAPLVGLCGVASVATSWSMLALRSRVGEWLGGTVLTLAVWWALPSAGVASQAWMLAVISASGAAGLALRAESRFRYLCEGAI